MNRIILIVAASLLLLSSTAFAEGLLMSETEYQEPGYLLVPSYQSTIDAFRNIGKKKDVGYLLLEGAAGYDSKTKLGTDTDSYFISPTVSGDLYLLQKPDLEITANYTYTKDFVPDAKDAEFQAHYINLNLLYKTDVFGLPVYIMPRYAFSAQDKESWSGYAYRNRISPVVAVGEDAHNLTELNYAYEFNSFEAGFDKTDLQSSAQRFGITHYYRFANDMHYIYAGLSHDSFTYDIDPDVELDGYNVNIGALVTLPQYVRVNLDYEFSNFEENTTADNRHTVSIKATKELYKNLILSLTYSYARNFSDNPSVEYSRNIYSANLTYIY
jgi:hypothetical protein